MTDTVCNNCVYPLESLGISRHKLLKLIDVAWNVLTHRVWESCECPLVHLSGIYDTLTLCPSPLTFWLQFIGTWQWLVRRRRGVVWLGIQTGPLHRSFFLSTEIIARRRVKSVVLLLRWIKVYMCFMPWNVYFYLKMNQNVFGGRAWPGPTERAYRRGRERGRRREKRCERTNPPLQNPWYATGKMVQLYHQDSILSSVMAHFVPRFHEVCWPWRSADLVKPRHEIPWPLTCWP